MVRGYEVLELDHIVVTIGLHSFRRHVGLPSFIPFPSHHRSLVQYDLACLVRYDAISSLRRLLLVRCDLALVTLYNINLGATTTMILSTWGVTIPIGLVSSTTDSI